MLKHAAKPRQFVRGYVVFHPTASGKVKDEKGLTFTDSAKKSPQHVELEGRGIIGATPTPRSPRRLLYQRRRQSPRRQPVQSGRRAPRLPLQRPWRLRRPRHSRVISLSQEETRAEQLAPTQLPAPPIQPTARRSSTPARQRSMRSDLCIPVEKVPPRSRSRTTRSSSLVASNAFRRPSAALSGFECTALNTAEIYDPGDPNLHRGRQRQLY